MPAELNAVGLLVAALGGFAVGLERQWSGHAEGAGARFAGIRTFTLLGALGGLGGMLWTLGLGALAVVLLSGAVAISVAAYIAGTRKDIEGTTEVAALVVVAAGVLAGTGSLRLASAIIALEMLLLAEKSRLHAAVRRIDDVGLRAGIRFAALALVVLPILPTGPYGPLGGVRPRELWAIVLFFSGLNFLGYVARRVVGAGRGYLVTGLLAGIVSSTNATFGFARLSRREQAHRRSLAFGAIGANAVLYPRVLLATAALNPSLLRLLVPYLVAPACIVATVAALGFRERDGDRSDSVETGNPLQLAAALRLAVLFQAVMMAVHWARGFWGEAGVLASAAVLGLTDVDALTTTMARSVAYVASADVAARAIAVGVLSNTVLKGVMAVSIGSGRFRTIVGFTLFAAAVTSLAAIILL